jgi:hypothetical protein
MQGKYKQHPQPIYEAAGVSNAIRSVEARLHRTKHLLTKRDALVEWMRTSKLHNQLFSYINVNEQLRSEKLNNLTRRSEFEFALQANTAFQRLLDRKASGQEVPELMRQGFLAISTGQREFTKSMALWVTEGGKGLYHSILDLTSSEDIFLRKEVSSEESLKVGGIPLKPIVGGKILPQTTVTRVGLYQINGSMLAWAENTVQKLEALAQTQRPIPRDLLLSSLSEDREWVNDDSLLIAVAIQDTVNKSDVDYVVLISSDRRLANQMSHTCNVTVILVEPGSILGSFPNKIWDSKVVITPQEIHAHLPPIIKWKWPEKLPINVYIDTGSLSAALSNLEIVETIPRTASILVRRTLETSGWEESSQRRFSSFILEEQGLNTIVSCLVYDPTRIQRDRKRYKSFAGPTRSDKVSWRSSAFLSLETSSEETSELSYD